MKLHYSFIMSSLKIISFSTMFVFVVGEILSEVCVWRNPEKTMSKIFPEAKDYKTITVKLSEEKAEKIEERLNAKLEPGEKDTWNYYEITGNEGKTLGYIIADAEKGEYGVIEIVMGITKEGKIKGIYVQRSREKDKEFKSEDFLKQFKDKTIKDPLKLNDDIKVKEETVAVKAVVFGVKKMLIFYDELKVK